MKKSAKLERHLSDLRLAVVNERILGLYKEVNYCVFGPVMPKSDNYDGLSDEEINYVVNKYKRKGYMVDIIQDEDGCISLKISWANKFI